jgi:hypothetical protein
VVYSSWDLRFMSKENSINMVSYLDTDESLVTKFANGVDTVGTLRFPVFTPVQKVEGIELLDEDEHIVLTSTDSGYIYCRYLFEDRDTNPVMKETARELWKKMQEMGFKAVL